MTDRDKVIKALECLSRLPQGRKCAGCVYFIPYRIANDPDVGWCDSTGVAKDALTLLREQEPQEPHYCEADDSWICGNCGETVGYGEFNPGGIDPVRNKYCPECGRAVKWDDAE